MSVENQKLWFNGKLLEDNQRLKKYEIHDGASLDVFTSDSGKTDENGENFSDREIDDLETNESQKIGKFNKEAILRFK